MKSMILATALLIGSMAMAEGQGKPATEEKGAAAATAPATPAAGEMSKEMKTKVAKNAKDVKAKHVKKK